jgi:transposase
MKKHQYRAKKLQDINWSDFKESLNGEALTLAVDIAKDQQFALLTDAKQTHPLLFKWSLLETQTLINELRQLNTSITVVMESTGTYGDAMRYRFREAGFVIYQVSAKRVHDSKEVYDGVPSVHDAKAACLIAKLHCDGHSRLWQELDDAGRALNAVRREYELHQSQYRRNQNRLEAYLSRHWPEVLWLLDLDSVTLEQLLIIYGSPHAIAADTEHAARQMQSWGGHFLSPEKIERVIASAAATIGQPCLDAERRYGQALASELQHSRTALPSRQTTHGSHRQRR